MRKSINVNIPHSLGQEEARRRLQTGIAQFRQQYGGQVANVEERWAENHLDFRFSVLGQAVDGRLDVLPTSVNLQVDLPWLLAAFAEKLRPQIEREGRRMLEHKRD